MNKFFTILIIIFIHKVGYGQLIITGGLPDNFTPSSTSFEFDTLRINRDSTFYELSKYRDSVLVYKEQQISVADCKIIFHGTTEQWYENGVKKVVGQFNYGDKIGLWKYWDKKGNLTQHIYM